MGVEEVPVCGKLPKKKKKTFPYNFILSLAILLPWTKMHVIVSLDKSPPWTKVSLDNCLLGLMSPRTNVSLDKCPLDNRLLGQLSPWTHGPWTNVSTPKLILNLALLSSFFEIQIVEPRYYVI